MGEKLSTSFILSLLSAHYVPHTVLGVKCRPQEVTKWVCSLSSWSLLDKVTGNSNDQR